MEELSQERNINYSKLRVITKLLLKCSHIFLAKQCKKQRKRDPGSHEDANTPNKLIVCVRKTPYQSDRQQERFYCAH